MILLNADVAVYHEKSDVDIIRYSHRTYQSERSKTLIVTLNELIMSCLMVLHVVRISVIGTLPRAP